ncbi:MAG: DMT family transporter [Planifilum fimeticola]
MNIGRFSVAPVPALIVGIVAISFSAIFIKWSDAPASILGMYRLLLTVLLMAPFTGSAVRREVRKIKPGDAGLLFLSGLFLGLHFLFWIESLRYTSVASSMIVLSLEPVFVAIGAYAVFRERTGGAALLGMGMALAGTVLIGWGDIGFSKEAVYGDFLSLLGTLAVSVHMLIGQRLCAYIPSHVYSFLVFSTAALVLAVYNLAAGIGMTGYPAREWGIFLLLAVVPTVFGHLLFNSLLRVVGATTVSMSILGEPVGAILLAYLLLGEGITDYQAVGGALTLAGLAVFLRTKRTGPSAEKPARESA